MVAINFKEVFESVVIKPDFSEITFSSPQKDGTNILILSRIQSYEDQHLPDVYNLGFGPPDGNGGIKDKVNLKHQNNSKVFSTVLFQALSFLNIHHTATIGIDGSDDNRINLYHIMFKSNKDYLSNFFKAFGVDWYVRIFRNGNYEADTAGNYIARPRAEPFNYQRDRHDLYRYYLFRLS